VLLILTLILCFLPAPKRESKEQKNTQNRQPSSLSQTSSSDTSTPSLTTAIKKAANQRNETGNHDHYGETDLDHEQEEEEGNEKFKNKSH